MTLPALLGVLAATAAFAGEKCDVPPEQRQSFEALGRLAGDFGWTIDKMKIDDGCAELRVTDGSGNVLKVKIDPARLDVIDGNIKRFGGGLAASENGAARDCCAGSEFCVAPQRTCFSRKFRCNRSSMRSSTGRRTALASNGQPKTGR